MPHDRREFPVADGTNSLDCLTFSVPRYNVNV